MPQGLSYVHQDHKPIESEHKKHNSRRYGYPFAGAPGLSGWGYTELRIHGVLGSFGPFSPGGAASVPETGTLAPMIRVLVTLSPRMYREAVALSVQRNRPGLVEVRLAPPEAMEAEIASFRPHLLVHDARGDPRRGSAPIPESAQETVPHRLEVLYSDGMDARISADGHLTEVRDASTEDLLGAVDGAAELAEREENPG